MDGLRHDGRGELSSLNSMSYARTVAARVEPPTYPLTVSVSAGNGGAGSVTGPGIACATSSAAGCTADVPNPPFTWEYTSVTVRAAADAGSVFKGWTGLHAARQGTRRLLAHRLSSAAPVWGRFEPSAYTLTAKVLGTATGTITGAGLDCSTNGGADCAASVPNPEGTAYATVTLRAVPSAGAVFKWWSGCTAVSGDPSACTVQVSGAANVMARFEPEFLPVSATTTGAGAGTIRARA